MNQRIQHIITSVKNKLKTTYRYVGARIERNPLRSFFTMLVILFVLITLSNVLRKPSVEKKETKTPTKNVNVYHIGTAPTIHLQGQVEKSANITVNALMGGIVQEINVTEGQQVARGTNFIWMTNNYQGGNTFSLMRQQAAIQYQNVLDTYDTQKDLINKQRDSAEKNRSNTEELRKITDASIADTESLISLNSSIVDSLDANINNLSSSNNNGSNDQQILAAKQMKSQYVSAINQLQSGLRGAKYQVNTDNPPTKLSDLQRDIALRQLDLQQKALDLSKEVSRIQLQIAQVNESTMHPVAPFSGVVQRIYVRVGQFVSPGTPLVSMSGDGGSLDVVVYAPKQIASDISKFETSSLKIGNKTLSVLPSFVSTEAIQGSLYAIKYSVPTEYASSLTDKGYIDVELPIGYPDTSATIPFVPIESVYQSRDEAYVYVNEKGIAKTRKVTLGEVYGSYVQVNGGLKTGDSVIVNRNIINGDHVSTQ